MMRESLRASGQAALAPGVGLCTDACDLAYRTLQALAKGHCILFVCTVIAACVGAQGAGVAEQLVGPLKRMPVGA